MYRQEYVRGGALCWIGKGKDVGITSRSRSKHRKMIRKKEASGRGRVWRTTSGI